MLQPFIHVHMICIATWIQFTLLVFARFTLFHSFANIRTNPHWQACIFLHPCRLSYFLIIHQMMNKLVFITFCCILLQRQCLSYLLVIHQRMSLFCVCQVVCSLVFTAGYYCIPDHICLFVSFAVLAVVWLGSGEPKLEIDKSPTRELEHFKFEFDSPCTLFSILKISYFKWRLRNSHSGTGEFQI